VPLKIVSLPTEARLELLEPRLLLVRPDQHVAWRGNEAPADCRPALGRVTGHEIASAIDTATN